MNENDWTHELNTGADFPTIREVELVTRGIGADFVVLAGSESSAAAGLWADRFNAEHPWTSVDDKAAADHPMVPLILPDNAEHAPLTGEVLHLVVTGVYADTRPLAAAVTDELARSWADAYNATHPWAHPDDKASVLGTIELIPGTAT